jgi:hypothetical protein
VVVVLMTMPENIPIEPDPGNTGEGILKLPDRFAG